MAGGDVGESAAMSIAPRGTVSFLFTDIEGSTRLLQALGRDRYGEALREHQRLLREVWQRHHGYEVDTEGDAFFVAFAHATDALAAAADAQRVLAAAQWEEGHALRVRIGIHSGEASEGDGKYVGVAVHRAARIAAAAHGGQVLVSEATRALAADEQLVGTSLRDLGSHRLKDLTEPQRLFQLLIDGLPLDFPPPRTLENRPTNLPSQHSPLIGRERELTELLELSDHADVHLLTLTGPGGVGKTRLALQLAAERIERFEHGVFFVNLAALTDPALVLPTIAQTVGVEQQPGEPIEHTLATALRDRRLLLVLDNFEQVLEAAAGIAAVLRATDTLKIVVTSRARLQLSAEHEYPIGSLGEPDALTLFTERAQAVKPSFSLNGNRAVVAEICARLDNLPLAIELAAARVKLLPEQALLDRLGERLKLLTGGSRDLDERQRTLRAAIDWSYQLLDEDEQLLFRRLAVFAGGRTLEAIEAICDGDLGIDVLDGLASLIDKSLLHQEEGVEGEPRFVMLETIHEYARERLDETDEAAEIRLRHASCYRELAAAEEAHRGTEARVRRLDAEIANFRLALAEFGVRKDVESELQLALSLWDWWYGRGRLDEARGYIEHGLAGTDTASDRPRALALDALGFVAFKQGRLAGSLQLFEEALAAAERCDDPVVIIKALEGLGLVAVSAGDFIAARRSYERALASARALGEEARVASLTQNLGDLALAMGDDEEARRHSSEAIAAYRALELEADVVVPLFNLAVAELHLRDPDSALAHALEVLARCREANREGIALSLELLAAIALRRQEPETAARMLGAAESLLSEIGYVLGPAEAKLHQETVEALGPALTEETLSRAWAEGAALSETEAADYAVTALSLKANAAEL